MLNEKPILEWHSHPFIERPLTSVLLIFILLVVNFAVWQIAVVAWKMPLFYILGLLLLLGNLLPYFIATRYTFYDDHFVVTYSLIRIRRKYSDFGCFYQDKQGIMLSTFKMPRRLDPFRGQSLRFSKSGTEREALLTLLTEKVGKQYR